MSSNIIFRENYTLFSNSLPLYFGSGLMISLGLLPFLRFGGFSTLSSKFSSSSLTRASRRWDGGGGGGRLDISTSAALSLALIADVSLHSVLKIEKFKKIIFFFSIEEEGPMRKKILILVYPATTNTLQFFKRFCTHCAWWW